MAEGAGGATSEGVRLPAGLEGSVDVLFDDRRVWSVSVDDGGPPTADGTVHVPWPDVLHRFLDGRVEVALRHHQQGHELFREEVAFGSGEGRVTVADQAGRPLAVTKYGRLNHPFDSLGRESVDAYLDHVEEVLRVLEECGIQGYLAWGSLLGAVRTGHMIGHDVDADIGYLTRHTTPADMMRESFRVERALRARGWQVIRENGGFLALFVDQPDGTRRNLDVFSGWYVDDWFHQVHDLRALLPRSAIEPLGTVTLEGRTFPAPADPAAWLEAAYGPGWRTPDPAFSFTPERARKRRVTGWLGGLRGRRDRWGRVLGQADGDPDGPSEFARWVHERDDPARPLVDLGSGRGDDALWFAADGRDVVGVEVVPVAVRRANRGARERGLAAHFEELNFADLRHALLLGTQLARRSPVSLYARGLVGDLPVPAEDNLWRTVAMGARGGGRLFLEFEVRRSEAGRRPGARVVGADPDQVASEVARRGGRVIEQEIGGPVDPGAGQVCRVMAEWSR